MRDLVRDSLDLSALVDTYTEDRGFPPYNPIMMTALLLYAYCQGLYASRRIAKACHEEWVECEVQGDTNVLWFLTLLNLRRRDNGTRLSVVILPDAIHAEDFRRLRVWLRWKADGGTPAS